MCSNANRRVQCNAINETVTVNLQDTKLGKLINAK